MFVLGETSRSDLTDAFFTFPIDDVSLRIPYFTIAPTLVVPITGKKAIPHRLIGVAGSQKLRGDFRGLRCAGRARVPRNQRLTDYAMPGLGFRPVGRGGGGWRPAEK